MRRGFLVKPDPTLTTPCDRPGCGDPEGTHLICGCVAMHKGRACQCPGFAVIPTCKFCGHQFPIAWIRNMHERFRTADCRRISEQRARDESKRQAARTRKAGVR